MSREAAQLLEQVLALPVEDRAAILDSLNESIRTHEHDLSAAWTAEVVRRVEAIESGTSPVIPGDDVLRRVRDRISAND